jgi:hypothetical protein
LERNNTQNNTETQITQNRKQNIQNSMASVRERTIPTERQPPVSKGKHTKQENKYKTNKLKKNKIFN